MKKKIKSDEAIHEFFGLSYAQYFVAPRTALQSMPSEWQEKFVSLVNEMSDLLDWWPSDSAYYQVKLKGRDGRLVKDPLADYERGRRRIKAKKST